MIILNILSRKKAFKLAWQLFWMATGTKRIGLTLDPDTMSIEFLGDALLKEKENERSSS